MTIIPGYIKLNRALRHHWVATDAEALALWIHILLNAAYYEKRTTDRGQFIILSPGQVLFRGLKWAEQTGIGKNKLYRTLQLLQNDGMIEIQKHGSRHSIITVKNWGVYQGETLPIEKTWEADKSKNDTHTDTENKEVECRTQDVKDGKAGSRKEADKKLYKKEKNDFNTYCAFFESVWSLYPNKKGKGQVSNTQKEKLFKIGLEQLTRCIERYKKDKPDWKQWQNGSTFFNSGYIDYLDSNFQDKDQSTKSGSKKEIVKAPDNFKGD